jgi:hypothetical protein
MPTWGAGEDQSTQAPQAFREPVERPQSGPGSGNAVRMQPSMVHRNAYPDAARAAEIRRTGLPVESGDARPTGI